MDTQTETQQAQDPILEALAEYEREIYALREPGLSESNDEKYQELSARVDAAADQVVRTMPTTLDGAADKLSWLFDARHHLGQEPPVNLRCVVGAEELGHFEQALQDIVSVMRRYSGGHGPVPIPGKTIFSKFRK